MNNCDATKFLLYPGIHMLDTTDRWETVLLGAAQKKGAEIPPTLFERWRAACDLFNQIQRDPKRSLSTTNVDIKGGGSMDVTDEEQQLLNVARVGSEILQHLQSTSVVPKELSEKYEPDLLQKLCNLNSFYQHSFPAAPGPFKGFLEAPLLVQQHIPDQSTPIVSVGSGQGAFEKTFQLLGYTDIVCLDPEPLGYTKQLGRKNILLMKPKYPDIQHLLQNQEVSDETVLFLIGPSPSFFEGRGAFTENYDLEALFAHPFKRAFLIVERNGAAGTEGLLTYLDSLEGKSVLTPELSALTAKPWAYQIKKIIASQGSSLPLVGRRQTHQIIELERVDTHSS